MDPQPSDLTVTDRLLWTGFAVFIALLLTVGSVAAGYAQTAYLAAESNSHASQLGHVFLVLCGMLIGAGLGFLCVRLFSERFVSVQTQRRWLGALNEALENPYVQKRAPGLVKMFRWAVVPSHDAL